MAEVLEVGKAYAVHCTEWRNLTSAESGCALYLFPPTQSVTLSDFVVVEIVSKGEVFYRKKDVASIPNAGVTCQLQHCRITGILFYSSILKSLSF